MAVRSNLSRRQWLAAVTSAASALGAGPSQRTLGAQLYTVRRIVRKEPDRVLKAISDIGYKEVEGDNRLALLALLPQLRQYGLTPRSCQVETPLITANWEAFPEFKQVAIETAIDSLANAGVEFFVMGYIPPGARGDGEDFFRRTADRMNAAAEKCRKAGLRFAWQNHSFEYEGRAGLRPVDIYRERLDPRLVSLELDVFHASMIGLDPVRMLKEWKGRVPLLRLNDKAKGTPRSFEENLLPATFTEVGAGDIDFAAILKAAPAAGVRAYSVGQDESNDPVESLRKSFEYLKPL